VLLSNYSFNGKEKDDEVYGDGNFQDYGMRCYDDRLGRFLSVDPLSRKYPFYSPYQFAGNKPIWATDLDGLEENFQPNPNPNNTVKIQVLDFKKIKAQVELQTEIANSITDEILDKKILLYSNSTRQTVFETVYQNITVFSDLKKTPVSGQGQNSVEVPNDYKYVATSAIVALRGTSEKELKDSKSAATNSFISDGVKVVWGVLELAEKTKGVPTSADGVIPAFVGLAIKGTAGKLIGFALSPSDFGTGDTKNAQEQEAQKFNKNTTLDAIKQFFEKKGNLTNDKKPIQAKSNKGTQITKQNN